MRLREKRTILTLLLILLVFTTACVPENIRTGEVNPEIPDTEDQMTTENGKLQNTKEVPTMEAAREQPSYEATESFLESDQPSPEDTSGNESETPSYVEHKGAKTLWETLRRTTLEEIDAHQKKIQELNLKLQLIDQIATRLDLTTRARLQQGHPILASFTIDNPTTYALKDISITCDQIAPTGTKIKTHTETIYAIVEATATRTFEGIELGKPHRQTTSLNCEIKNFTVHTP